MTITRKIVTDDRCKVRVVVNDKKAKITISTSYGKNNTITTSGQGLSAWGMLSMIECHSLLSGKSDVIIDLAVRAIQDASIQCVIDPAFSVHVEKLKAKLA